MIGGVQGDPIAALMLSLAIILVAAKFGGISRGCSGSLPCLGSC